MGISYRKHEEFPDSILVRDFVGEVQVKDIIESWEYIIENELITPTTVGVINNLLDCELCMDMASFNALISFLKQQEALSGIRLAVLCNKPETIIFPMLGEKKEPELQIKAFATMDAAVHWVMYGMYEW